MATTDNGVFTLTNNTDGVGTQTLSFDSGTYSDLLTALTVTSGTVNGHPALGSNVTVSGGSYSFSNVTEIYMPAAAGLASGTVTVGGNTLPIGSGNNVGIEFRVDGTALILGATQLLGGLDPAGTGTVQIGGSGSALEVATATGSGNTIAFSGGNGSLIIDHAASFGSGQGTAAYAGDVIAQFAAGDTVDFADVPFAGAAIKSYNAATGLLVITSGTQTADLIYGSSSQQPTLAQPFLLTADAMGGVLLGIAGVPCYAPWTRIRMANGGEVEIELISIGDMVMTASGEAKPVLWIGRRSYAGRFLAANPKVQPIIIRKGALGRGLPRRDLVVSPEHALFLDGVLVAAKLLVNGRSIVRASLAEVSYIHLELDGHDIVYAEGVTAETFVDDDSRMMFHNAAEYAELYPNAPEPTGYCAPRVESGYELEAIRSRLNRARLRQKAA
jgi:hypothetical protein